MEINLRVRENPISKELDLFRDGAGDYVTKDEGTEWKYKPCYDKAVKLLGELEG